MFHSKYKVKMKKIKYILAGMTVLFLYSCNDVLDTVPTDRLPSELFWKTDPDAEYAANSIYHELEGFWELLNLDCYTDIGHYNFNSSDETRVERGAADAQNAVYRNYWARYYKGIRLCNDYMENIHQVEVENQDKVNAYTGEVKTLRAYFYLRLVTFYGDVPLILKTISIEEGKEVARTPAAEVWSFIEKELTEAAALLPVTAAQQGRITKGAANALRARAMLYKGDYEKAAQAAREVIDSRVYDLYPSYQKLFSYEAEGSREIIFDHQYMKDQYNNNVINNYGAFSLGTAGPHLTPTRTLVDAYRMTNGKKITDAASGYDPYEPYKNRDPRLSYSIYVPGDLLPDGSLYDSRPFSNTPDAYGGSYKASTTGFAPKKYINPEDVKTPSNCGINLVIMRYAEILLTYAEARIELGQIDETVLEALNAIRQRSDVNMPPIPSGLSQGEMREIVRHERMVELALEGHRYFDILRWKIAEDVCNTPLMCLTYVNEEGKLIEVQDDLNPKRFDKAKHYLWPIPYNERLFNPNLTQNPNWE